MTRRAKIALASGCALLAVLSCRLSLMWLAHYLSTPHEPRPLFHEWELTDRGWGWKMGGAIRDARGTYAFCDRTLNMLIVVATGDPQCSTYVLRPDPNETTVLGETPYATPVRAAPDTLYIKVFPGEATLRVHLGPGVAKQFYERFAYSGCREEDLLARVLEMYEGTRREELEDFLRLHNAAALGKGLSGSAIPPGLQPSQP